MSEKDFNNNLIADIVNRKTTNLEPVNREPLTLKIYLNDKYDPKVTCYIALITDRDGTLISRLTPVPKHKIFGP